MQKNNTKIFLGVLVIVVLGGLAFTALNVREDRSIGEKIEDAAGKLDEGVDDAARELQDRTPAERIQDGYEDATDGNPG